MRKEKLLKELEYSSKSFFSDFFKPSFNPKIITDPSFFPEFSKLKKILVLRHDRIGDALVTSPLVRALRQITPNAEIHILMSKKNIGAKSAFLPFADRFHIYDKNIFKAISLINILRKEKFDLIIDPYNKQSATNSMLIKFIKPKNALGFWKENFSSYTHAVKIDNILKLNITIHVLQLISAFGKPPDIFDPRPNFYLEDNVREYGEILIPKNENHNIGLVLSGSDRAKYWGSENFCKLINKLKIKYTGCSVYLFATPDYDEEKKAISKQTCSYVAPRMIDADHYASILSRMDYLVTPDTSAVHFASAFGIPVIVLYNYDKLNNPHTPWYPTGVQYIAIEHPENINLIPPEKVFASFVELIEK